MSVLSKTIEVCGQSYTIKFPNVGQFIDIRVKENQLSQGSLRDLLLGVGNQIDAYLYITTFAHFVVLCPELIKDLKVDSLLDLSIVDFQELSNLFVKEIRPWISEVQESLRREVVESNESEQSKI